MGTKSDWGKLFENIDFFNEYRHFIVVIISANNEENFEFWFVGFIDKLQFEML